MHQSPFYCLNSRRKLASLLRTTWDNLDEITSSHSFYSEYQKIDKSSGKKRYVEEPIPRLKTIHQTIDTFLSRIDIPAFLHSPAKNCSQLTNASVHQYSKAMMTLDIKSYFESTSSQRVYWFFHKRMQCSPDVAAVLTKLSTHNSHLPTGGPCSPRLAYFSHLDMWEKIYEVVHNSGYILTVYMDDVTISGNHISKRLIWSIKQVIHSYGLQYHKEKLYSKQPFEITGVIIHNNQVAVPKRQFYKLHQLQLILDQEVNDDEQFTLQRRVQGHIAHIRHIQSSGN